MSKSIDKNGLEAAAEAIDALWGGDYNRDAPFAELERSYQQHCRSTAEAAIAAYLSASPQPQAHEAEPSPAAQPVAWQHRGKRAGERTFGPWKEGRNQSFDTAEGDEYEERALAHSPPRTEEGGSRDQGLEDAALVAVELYGPASICAATIRALKGRAK